MKKKLLTLVALLTTVVSGAWADTEVFSYDATGSTITYTDGATVTLGDCSQITSNSNKGIKLDAVDDYIKIDLPSSVTIATGDVITITQFQTGTSSPNNNYGTYICGANETSTSTPKVTIPTSQGKDSGSGTYTVQANDELTGKSTFYLKGLFPSNKNVYMQKIVITRADADASELAITPTSGLYVGKATVSMSAASGYTIYYTNDGTDPTNSSTEYTGKFDVTTTQTIKAIAYNGVSHGKVKTATYTIVPEIATYDFTAPTAADWTALTSNTDAWSDNDAEGKKYLYNTVKWTKNTDYALEGSDGTDISVANGLLFGRAGNDISSEGVRYYYEIGGVESYALYANNSSFYIKVPNVAIGQQVIVTMSANGADADGKARTISATNATPASITYSEANNAKKVLVFTASADGTLTISNAGGGYYIYSIIVCSTATVSVGATGWSTFSSDKALDFTNAEVEAYMITGFEGTTLTTSKVTGTVPASTGLLVKGTASTSYTVPVVESSTTDVTANKMVACVSATTVNAGTGTDVNYVLMNNNGKAEFQWIGSISANIGANKAYLTLANGPKPTSNNAPGLTIDIDNNTTGIANTNLTNRKNENGQYYNLNGQRVAQPTKGLYIVNGKKVIMK